MIRSIIIISFVSISSLAFAQTDGGTSDGGGSGGAQEMGGAGSGGASDFSDLNQRSEQLEALGRIRIAQNKKARPKFASLFDQAQSAILKDDTKKAGSSIAKLHEITNLNLYEESRLHLVDYWYYGKLGNKELEFGAASKLMEVGAGNVDSHAFVEAGMRLLKRQYNNQDLGGAIETLNNLRKESESQAELMPIFSVVKKLDDFAEQKTDIVQKITMNETGAWSAKLFRPQFFFNGIAGEINALAFDCTNKQAMLNYKADSVMEIPEAWGVCTMKVTAKPNTAFNLVQMQKKPV